MDLFSSDKYSLCCAERAEWYPMNESREEDKKDEIWDWLYPKIDDYKKYYMLLCREKNDYTIFSCAHSREETNDYANITTNIVNELVEVLHYRGNWIAGDYDEKNDAWQLWVNRGGQANVYLFFEAEGFVIEC